MNCEACQEVMSDCLNGLADEKTFTVVKSHMAKCLSCYEVYKELALIIIKDIPYLLHVLNTIEVTPPPLKHPESPLAVEINNEFGFSRALRVFLCYSSEDRDTVLDLHQRLEGDGIKPWLDIIDLLPGQDWKYTINEALHDTDAVIACISRSFLKNRRYLRNEIKVALELQKEYPKNVPFLIPLRLEECNVSVDLKRFQHTDYFKERGYEELRRSLKYIAGRSHTRAPNNSFNRTRN